MRDLSELPDGWRLLRLEDVAEVNPRRPTLNIPIDVPTTFVPMAAVGENCRGLIAYQSRPYGEISKGYTYFENNDVLFAKITPCLQNGKHALVSSLKGGFGFGTTEFHTVRAGDRLEPRLLYRTLTQPQNILKCISSFAGTAGQQRVQPDVLRSLWLMLPPLAEQRAISDVLDAIDEAIERIEAVIRATERLRHALLHELLTRGVPGWHTQWRRVSGLGVFPSDWRVIELRDIGQLRYGTSMQLSSTGGGYAVLRIPNVAPGYLDTSVLKFADLSQREADVLSLQSGDLLIVRTNGNPDICGQSVVFDGLEGKWAFASYLLRLRTESRVLSPIYLWAFLRSAVGRRQLRANVQTSAGNYNLSVGGLASVRMALPEIEEQMRIVEVVQSLADSLAREACRIGRLRNLRSSVSDALLTGRVRTIDVREPAI